MKKILLGLVIACSFIFLTVTSLVVFDKIFYSEEIADSDGSDETGSCNVLGINLHGYLVTYVPTVGSADDQDGYDSVYGDAVGSEDLVSSIRQANLDENIKAIMIEVDSGGGSAVAGEEIFKAIDESTKPVVAYIRDIGASAAYLAISSADKILASRNSDVGSIGVTMSYLENTNEDKKYIQISSGKFKDAGDPDRPISEEERLLFLRDIKKVHENFIEDVAKNRKLTIENVRIIADGSTVLGDRAKSLGLIDEIGGWAEAEKYIEEEIGELSDVCWH